MCLRELSYEEGKEVFVVSEHTLLFQTTTRGQCPTVKHALVVNYSSVQWPPVFGLRHFHKASSECVPCPSSFVCRLSKSVFVKDGRLTPWSRQRRMYGCGTNQSTSKVTEKILVSNLCLYHLHSWLSGSLKTFLLPYVCILTWRYTLPY